MEEKMNVSEEFTKSKIGCGNTPKMITNTTKLAITENSTPDRSFAEDKIVSSPSPNIAFP